MDLHQVDHSGLTAYFLAFIISSYALLFLLKIILNVFKRRDFAIIRLNILSLFLWAWPLPTIFYLDENTSIYDGDLDNLMIAYSFVVLSAQAFLFSFKLKLQGAEPSSDMEY